MTRSMTVRTAGRLAMAVWLALLVMSLAELWMIVLTLHEPAPDQWAFRGFEAVLALSFGSVGAVIAARRPDNRIGWLLLAIAAIGGLMGLVNQYPVLADARSSLPFAGVARWISAWLWILMGILLGSLLPLIFPDGRLLSRRWRWAVALDLLAGAVFVASIILVIEPLGPLRASTQVILGSESLTPLMGVGILLYFAAVATAAASLVLRYRRAGEDERRQIKWIACAGMLAVPGAIAGMTPLPVGQLFLLTVAVFFAAAIAIAVLRYRLYEIDVIINRTLVYGALSAILAGVYTASITLSQRVFMAVTGERSDAAIVLTTLIVAATFTPLKARLQATVDRRVTASPGARSEGSPAAGGDPASVSLAALGLLPSLATLHDRGVLTAAEFRIAKGALLALAVPTKDTEPASPSPSPSSIMTAASRPGP